MTPQELINFWKQKIKQNEDENNFLQSIIDLAEQGWKTNQDWMNGEVEKKKFELENEYSESFADKNEEIISLSNLINEKNIKIEELSAIIAQDAITNDEQLTQLTDDIPTEIIN